MTQPTFSDSVRSYIAADRSALNVSIPARITSYNPTLQKCSCKPLIDNLLRDGRRIGMPLIEDIPVIFPSTNLSALTFPVNIGDTVLLLFSQRSLDNWLSSRDTNPVNPEDFRKHNLSDAIAIPGLFSFPRAINDLSKHTLVHDTDDLVVAHNIGTANENEVRLKEDGTIRISSGAGTKITLNLDGTISIDAPTSISVTSPTTTWVGDINLTGTITATVDVVGGGKSLKTHIHPQGVDSAGDTQVNTGAPV